MQKPDIHYMQKPDICQIARALLSIPRPEHDLKQGPASRATFSAPQVPFELHQTRVARTPMQRVALGMMALWAHAWQLARTRWKARRSLSRKA
jgi:hypothetical protein